MDTEVVPIDISIERKTTLMCEPHLMAFTHILEHLPNTPQMEAEGIIACTDGDTVWYGSKYLRLPPPQRAYIHVHELSHGIFRHPDRALLIRLNRGTINPALWNNAADAIINEGIEANPSMPSGMFQRPAEFPPVLMESTIHAAIQQAIRITGENPPGSYDPKAKHGLQAETVYDWLMWAYDAVRRKRREDCPRAQDEKNNQAKKKPAPTGKEPPADEQRKPGAQDDKAEANDNEGESQDRAAGDGEEGQEGQPGGDEPGEQPGEGERPGEGEGACDPRGKPSDKPCTCGQCPGGKAQGKGQGGQPGGAGQGGGQGQPGAGQPGGQGDTGDGQEEGSSLIERMAGGDAWDLVQQLDKIQDLLDKGYTTSELIEKINEKMESARLAIEQIVQGLKSQGRGQGSLLLELAADMPRPVVPWNHILRRVATRGLGTKLNDSYTRWGFSTTSAIARRSRHVPFSPGTTIFTERPRVLVILDVSGSHIGMLPVCFAEIWSIAQMKGAIVEVMTFDDGVQEVIEIRNRADFNKIMKNGIRGGGGTWLGDVWAKVAKMRDPYRMAVVMTDGYLDAGKKPKIPVVWLVTHGGRTDGLNYGEVISLPELEAKRKAA